MGNIELTYQEVYDNFRKFHIIDSVHKLTMCFRVLKVEEYEFSDGTFHSNSTNVYGLTHHGKKYELIKNSEEHKKQYFSGYEFREVDKFETFDTTKTNHEIVCINEVDMQLIPVPDKKKQFASHFGIDIDLLPKDFDELMKNNIVMKGFIFIFDPITINGELYLGLYENLSYKLMAISEYNKKYGKM